MSQQRSATLVFTPDRARWVASERWHPKQKGKHLPDGSYELRIPYADDRKLMMDILGHGAAVTLVKPQALKKKLEAETLPIA